MVSKVELAFTRLLGVFNKKRNKWTKGRDGKLRAIVGSWTLDSGYGGYKVSEIVNKGGGERDLFDNRRRKPSDFVRWVDITIAAKRQK